MIYTASAPGKLVLLGEYAVLEGAEALVMAVDRRVKVTLKRTYDSALRILAPPLINQALPLTTSQLKDSHQSDELALVKHVLVQLSDRGLLALEALLGWELRIDSQALFQDGNKLGLGSSAAVTVALVGVLCAFSKRAQACNLELVMALHKSFQGSGSGLDVATSHRGGLIAFSQDQGRATVESLVWPNGLDAVAVWSGASASTAGFLERLKQFQQSDPDSYQSLMDDLVMLAQRGVAAARQGSADAFVGVVREFYQALGRLDDASGIGIITETHRQLGMLLQLPDSVYKTCGAGGGDLGVFLTCGAGQTEVAQGILARAGHPSVPLALDRRGLETEIAS